MSGKKTAGNECTNHNVQRIKNKCGCLDYRCFSCKRGMRIRCGNCGGGLKRL